jgi:hypothetical protein
VPELVPLEREPRWLEAEGFLGRPFRFVTLQAKPTENALGHFGRTRS